MSGIVHGIGTGPGDPELLTARAIRVIGEADDVFYVEADGKPSRAFATAGGHVRSRTARHAIPMPMRTDPAAGSAAYDTAARKIRDMALSGRSVAVLCEGDPLLYGSFIHLLDRLRDEVPVEITPGIPSFLAGAAALQHGLVRRMDRLSLLPATLDEERLTAALRTAECVAILKTGRHLAKVRRSLASAVFPEAFVVIEASGDNESMTPLSAFEGDSLPYFAIVLAWRETLE